LTIELKPEQERIIQDQLASGHFQSVDEVLAAALGRLPRTARGSNHAAVERVIEFAEKRFIQLPPGENIRDLVHEGHRY
jgi:Arc/MetJ-type ribon-helix-helix transcriptional regulator